MSSSIKRGVESVSNDAQAMLIALTDQPQIGPDVCNRLISAYEKNRPPVVVPTYDGRNGHPIILDASLKDEILAMDPEQGLRQVVHAHESRIVRVEIADDSVLKDFDFPEDYNCISNE